MLPRPPEYFLSHLTHLGRILRDAILRARSNDASFAGVSRQTSADTIYQIDAHVEPTLDQFCNDWSEEIPFILVAEGVHSDGGEEGVCVYPKNSDPARAQFQLLVDPIDGTRGLMYDKRSAWVLAGIAPNHGPATRLSHIEVAMQAEIPTSKQNLADILWAIKGQGAHALRENLATHQSVPLTLKPSTADTLAHGFASVVSFFPGTKILSAELLEFIVQELVGTPDPGTALVFDDQYISTAGQFYELIIGHDRFIADPRPYFYQIQKQPPGLCCHPYDCASALIAHEAGIILTNANGQPLDGPLDTTTPIPFAAYANRRLAEKIEPLLHQFLKSKGLR